MTLYKYHFFFCTNERPDGHPRGCCKRKGSEKIRAYMKARIKELGLSSIRINASGCLDRCEDGPTVVVYPEGVWYQMNSIEDVERVIAKHIQQEQIVEELLMNP